MQQQRAEIQQKLAIERKVYSGANAMLASLKDENARQTCQVSVIESQRRIDFLESELARLSVVPSPVSVDIPKVLICPIFTPVECR